MGKQDNEKLEARLLMDVSDVGKNVASMGRMLRAGFGMHFAREGHNCWMERDGQATALFEDDECSEAPLYYMRFRVLPPPTQHEQRRGLLVAPLSVDEFHEGCEVEVAGLARDQHLNGRVGVVVGRKARVEGQEPSDRWSVRVSAVEAFPASMAHVKAANFRRLDLPKAEVPTAEARTLTLPVQMRATGGVPSKAVFESHNLAHVPAADWCEICIAAKSTANQHPQAEAKVIPMVQVDYQYMSGTDELDTSMQAKATLLTMVDTEFGYLGLVQVAKKGDDAFAIRYLASFLDRMRCDEVRLRYDNENTMVQLTEKVRAFRSPRKTTLEPIVRAEHEMVGPVERAIAPCKRV